MDPRSNLALRCGLLALAFAMGAAGCFRKIERDVVVEVPKLVSPDCFTPIQEALRPLDGIVSATADIPNRRVIVRYNSEKLGIRNIEFVIAGAGFQANELPLNSDAHAQLPAGCR